MPTYIRPARVDITEGGSVLGTVLLVLGPALLITAAVMVIGAVAAFILGHLLLLAGCALATGAGTLGAVLFLRRYMVIRHCGPPQHIRPVDARAAILAPPRAIAPVQHIHLHLHGVSPADIAEALAQLPAALPPPTWAPDSHPIARREPS